MRDKTRAPSFVSGGKYNCSMPMSEEDRRSVFRRSMLKRTYDISLEDLARIIAYQDGCCALCVRPLASDEKLVVDHDHDVPVRRDSVRGVLHHMCNRVLGWIESNPLLVSDHVRAYLEKPPAQEALRGITAVHPDFKGYRRAKLDDDQVREMRRLRAEGVGRKELAERFGVSFSNVKTILANRTWQNQAGYEQQQIKLNLEKARQIRYLRVEGAQVADLASQFGVTDQTIRNVVDGKTWREPS